MSAALEVVAAPAPALVQDAGRPGRMHMGLPPGGPLVPELLARANRSLGNPWGAAALELFGPLEVVARGALALSLDGEVARLVDGERFQARPAPGRRVRYLALAGGVDVPEQLGGRGTLPVARLGGLEGRALRRGDVLAAHRVASLTGEARGAPALLPVPEAGGAIRVVLGPDLARFGAGAVEGLLGEAFRVSPASDRVGQRLVGPRLPRADGDAADSAPMWRGALQVPGAGEVIALGPDHPTVGGYPVLAGVIRADWGRLAARAAGAEVRFRAVEVEEARAAWEEHARQWFG